MRVENQGDRFLIPGHKKKPQVIDVTTCGFIIGLQQCLLHLVNDGLESLGVVDGEVGEHLAVDLDASLCECAHQL